MTTNNGWNNGNAIAALSANQSSANLFQITATISTTQTLTTSTAGGNIYLCTNSGNINITLPAPNTFTYLDFVFSGTGNVTLVTSGTFNGLGATLLFPPNTVMRGARIFSDGTNLFTLFALPNGTYPIGMNLPQPTISQPSIFGVTDGSNAAPAIVGQFVSASITSASPVALTNNTAVNVISISLTAGDWDAWGNITFINNTGTTSAAQGWISSTSATQPDASLYLQITGLASANNDGLIVPTVRFSFSTTTTIYLSSLCVFTVGLSACGTLSARRRR